MKILIILLLTLAAVPQANASTFLRRLCTKYLYVDVDPWPFAEYSNRDLYDTFQTVKTDDVKKEISFRLMKSRLSQYDRALLMSTLANLTPDERREIVVGLNSAPASEPKVRRRTYTR